MARASKRGVYVFVSWFSTEINIMGLNAALRSEPTWPTQVRIIEVLGSKAPRRMASQFGGKVSKDGRCPKSSPTAP